MTIEEKVSMAAEYIKSHSKTKPEVILVLGSGLGKTLDNINTETTLSYEQIPNWPRSTAPGHAGQLILGTLCGHNVAVMQGRVHYYEGYKMSEIVFPIRVLASLGASKLILTNAAGGIPSESKEIAPGYIVGVKDHINLLGTNPLVGPNVDHWGVRFPDMTFAYNRKYLKIMQEIADKHNIPYTEGVYIAMTGPSYETPAEIRMARILGANVVGMSTVPEVITARHMGLETAVFSCVSNYAAGITDEKLTEEEVLEAMHKVSDNLSLMINELLLKI